MDQQIRHCLPQHSGPVSRRFKPDESAAGSFDHDRRIQVLRESSRTSLWSSVCLWSGHQDTQERSSGQSRAKSCDRSWEIEASTEGFRRFRETEYLVCRAPESHDPTGLGLSRSPNDMSGPVEGTSRRSARAASLPLQFREASSRIEIWTGNQDARKALRLRQFSYRGSFLWRTKVIFALFETVRPISFPIRDVCIAARQQLMTEAPTLLQSWRWISCLRSRRLSGSASYPPGSRSNMRPHSAAAAPCLCRHCKLPFHSRLCNMERFGVGFQCDSLSSGGTLDEPIKAK